MPAIPAPTTITDPLLALFADAIFSPQLKAGTTVPARLRVFPPRLAAGEALDETMRRMLIRTRVETGDESCVWGLNRVWTRRNVAHDSFRHPVYEFQPGYHRVAKTPRERLCPQTISVSSEFEQKKSRISERFQLAS
jgi:hypothetical protein